jgi:hypothetical protein
MKRNEAARVMDEMDAAGFDTNMRRWNDGDAVHAASYEVSATDRATGINIVISTVEQWNERKQAAAFEAQHNGATAPTRRAAPVQVSPSGRLLEQLADLRRWWGMRHNADVMRSAVNDAWYREQAKQDAKQQEVRE